MKTTGICLAAALSALPFAAPAPAAAAECGRIEIADMSSQTAELLANLDMFILNNGFGCSASLVAGDTVPGITSMIEKGRPHIIPEGAVDVVPELVERGVGEGRIVETLNPLGDAGEQGLYIPQYMVDANPELATIEGVLAHPELFPSPEDPSKGAIFNGAPGWGAAVIVDQLFDAWNMDDKGFVLTSPGSLAGLDAAISRANDRKEGIIGYYWAPTGLLGTYKMHKVDLGVQHDAAEWKRCTTVETCNDPKPNTWPASETSTLR